MNEQESKKQILKSTGILGFAQIFTIIIGIARVKILAVLLGAVGVGIAGLYQNTIDLIKSATGFGLSYSAVRDIASSATSEDEKNIAVTVLVLRQWVWGTGLLGMIITIVFCKRLSIWAFDTTEHAWGIAVLSLGVLLSSISGGQNALLQGLRQIGNMAKANVYSALLSLLSAAIIYYIWGLSGIVPAVLSVYVISLIVNWFYSRKINIIDVPVSLAEVLQKGKKMASLGFFMSLTMLTGTATMYIVRSYVVQQGGLASVGYFIAAWTISSMYISAIFSAMGADYFPRLSSIQEDKTAVRKLINDQTEIALLITTPIIIGMVSFIDIVVKLFYSKEFGPTASILDWQLLGDFFKVLAWPMGFITLAKGKGNLFIMTELCWNIIFYSGVYFGWKLFGIQITGISFLISYILYTCIIFCVAYKLVGFKWSGRVIQYCIVFIFLLSCCFFAVRNIHSLWRYALCGLISLVAILFSLNHLRHLIDIKSILKKFRLIR
jgi:O-antigen/teichoic acid export membrane protein